MRNAERSGGIKARSTPAASLAVIGQVTTHTTVKWPILFLVLLLVLVC